MANGQYIDIAELNKLNLTGLEALFMQGFVNGLYAEPGFSDQAVTDVAKEMSKLRLNEVSVSSAKGLLGSLVKKGIVWTDSPHDDGTQILYLEKAHYNLHKEWAKEEW